SGRWRGSSWASDAKTEPEEKTAGGNGRNGSIKGRGNKNDGGDGDGQRQTRERPDAGVAQDPPQGHRKQLTRVCACAPVVDGRGRARAGVAIFLRPLRRERRMGGRAVDSLLQDDIQHFGWMVDGGTRDGYWAVLCLNWLPPGSVRRNGGAGNDGDRFRDEMGTSKRLVGVGGRKESVQLEYAA
ncbi:hypothetical protein IMZ48_35895, partial [Candidatus Bathyarchaeota archaeon]|nr:hypothetical protein [Candidatus Bathyarchaeota archaeon]